MKSDISMNMEKVGEFHGKFMLEKVDSRSGNVTESIDLSNSISSWVNRLIYLSDFKRILAAQNGTGLLNANNSMVGGRNWAKVTTNVNGTIFTQLLSRLCIGYDENQLTADNNKFPKILYIDSNSEVKPIDDDTALPIIDHDNNMIRKRKVFEIPESQINDKQLNTIFWITSNELSAYLRNLGNGMTGNAVIINSIASHYDNNGAGQNITPTGLRTPFESLNTYKSVYTYDSRVESAITVHTTGNRYALILYTKTAKKFFKIIDLKTGLETYNNEQDQLLYSQVISPVDTPEYFYLITTMGLGQRNYFIDLSRNVVTTYVYDLPLPFTPEIILRNGYGYKIDSYNTTTKVLRLLKYSLDTLTAETVDIDVNTIIANFPDPPKSMLDTIPFSAQTCFKLISIDDTPYIQVVSYTKLGTWPVTLYPVFDFDSNLVYRTLPDYTCKWARARNSCRTGNILELNSALDPLIKDIHIEAGVQPNYAVSAMAHFPTMTKNSNEKLRITYEFTLNDTTVLETFHSIVDAEQAEPVEE